MAEEKKLTIFTPTYNRAALLTRLYESLINQTSNDFSWLIVDDGSTDDTKSLVDKFISENKIPIKYIYRENGGKMRAHNDGVKNADTPYFLCVDSDDFLVPCAVSSLLEAADEKINKIGKGREKIAGIIAHKGKSETELLSGVEFPKDTDISALFPLYLKGFRGETTIMFVRDVIKKFPFPEIEGEKYVPEDYVYDKIDMEYKYIILDKIITVCEIVEKGYTDSAIKLKHDNPKAFHMYYEQRALITPPSVLKIKYAGFYVKYAKICKKRIFDTELPKPYIIMGALASVFIHE